MRAASLPMRSASCFTVVIFIREFTEFIIPPNPVNAASWGTDILRSFNAERVSSINVSAAQQKASGRFLRCGKSSLGKFQCLLFAGKKASLGEKAFFFLATL